jgi:hypothetical protein
MDRRFPLSPLSPSITGGGRGAGGVKRAAHSAPGSAARCAPWLFTWTGFFPFWFSRPFGADGRLWRPGGEKGTGGGGHPAVQAPRPPRAADFAARCCGGRGAALSTAASGSVALWATQWAGALGRRDGAAPWPRRGRNNREPLTWTDFYHPAHLGRADRRDDFPRRRVGRMKWNRYPPGICPFHTRRKTKPPRGGTRRRPGLAPQARTTKNMVGEALTPFRDDGTQTSGPLHRPGHSFGARRGRAAAASGGGRRALTAGDLTQVWG